MWRTGGGIGYCVDLQVRVGNDGGEGTGLAEGPGGGRGGGASGVLGLKGVVQCERVKRLRGREFSGSGEKGEECVYVWKRVGGDSWGNGWVEWLWVWCECIGGATVSVGVDLWAGVGCVAEGEWKGGS